jgi:hypothetical protein
MLLRVHCSAQSIIQGEITDKVAQKEIRKIYTSEWKE